MKVIVWIDKGGVLWGTVLDESRDRFQVEDERGRQNFVPRKKVRFQLTADPAAGSDALSRLRAYVESMASDIDLELLWSMVVEEGTHSRTLEELAHLYFGNTPTVEEVLALWLRLRDDPLYFRVRGPVYEPRTPTQVEALRHQQAAERARQERRRWMIERLQAWLHHPPTWTEEDRALAETVVAFFQRKTDEKTATELQDVFAAIPELQDDPTVLIPIIQTMGIVRNELEGMLIYYGVDPDFTPEDIKTAAVIAPFTPPSDRQPVEGVTFSIDEAETAEIDDAFSYAVQADGRIEVGIHIADAAFFVKKDAPLDRVAERRLATLYLPEGVFYMLPPPLATDKASLLPEKPRPVLSLITRWDSEGQLLEWSLESRWLTIHHRLSYAEADAIVQRPTHHPLHAPLRWLYDRALAFFKERLGHGAVHLVRPEMKVRVQQPCGDHPIIEIRRLDLETPAHVLVREWMIFYNAHIAEWSALHDLPMIYRAQDPPEEPLSVEGLPSTYRPAVFRTLVRHFRRSILWPTPRLHWALGLEAYTQASSPIRRYADLVIQRQVVTFLQQRRVLYSKEALLKMMTVIEDQTIRLKELEEKRKRYWILRFLSQQPPDTIYPATVLERKPGSLYIIELDDYLLEGVMPCSLSLEPDQKVSVRLVNFDWRRLNYKAQLVR